MHSSIRAIAFDLWNTLIGCAAPVNPMLRLLEAVRAAGAPDPLTLVSEATMTSPLPGLAAALEELERRLGCRLARGRERARLLGLWRCTTGCNHVFEDVEPSLRRLRQRYRIGVISNTQSFDLEFWERSAARALMEVEVLSYEERVLKPDTRLFRRFARALGVRPQQVLMVGDNMRDDIEGSRAAGFEAVRIRRNAPSLSHREPSGNDTTVRDLNELERWLENFGHSSARR